MAQLHLVTGHRSIQRADAPTVIYCGFDADAAAKARDKALETGFAVADQYSPSAPVSRFASPEKLQEMQDEATRQVRIAERRAAESAAKAEKAKQDLAAAEKAKQEAEATAAAERAKQEAEAATAAERAKQEAEAATAAEKAAKSKK